MGWKTFADRLAIIVLVLYPIAILGNAYFKLGLSGQTEGIFTGIVLLVAQFYFRKREAPAPTA